ncbi:UDP-N-acetylmuramoyl-L-alanyl-D-glutamate--2,6-diaminopimelate ligase [Patescibacteria group bacterium]|nr:UDP-N-acetylmuramoyl-L-alanyl-D-glutamate--2,6-diaminopimelate ligase [Patescibacteria group bacterium]MCG2695292.1 UDP-N-acetylmuramoyl-L-alanyl-D-glutamate--2,6-diaminopimelate ligase [Candidatus Parcubacteria bacterium]
MLNNLLYKIKKLIPQKIFTFFQPIYHYLLSLLGAIIYRFPSRKIFVIAITGTKGKTSTAELVNAILEEAGFKTAMLGTLRFKIGKQTEMNKHKMTMPGRFFVQQFLRKAVREKCDYVIVESTSQGVLQFRHKFILMNALIFTNLSPEHIESHGSYENYVEAKLKIVKQLEKNKKQRKILVVNEDDAEAPKFLKNNIKEQYKYSLRDAEPFALKTNGLTMTFDKKEINSHLSGKFNIYNILAAATFAKTQNIGTETIKKAIEKFKGIRGRVEKIEEGQKFTIVVDYAHTADSLEKLYEAFPNTKRICILGNTGGGRDVWKRPVMGSVADKYCSNIILTNEDPYDEDPKKIVEDMAEGIKNTEYEIIMDRREAINKALSIADTGDTVLITGKGTDPYIMGPNNTKLKWDDADVVRKELSKILLGKQ